ncbi:hypothetical protein T440DRAFT_533632 [Plenodomus tracheiphilus IPT5]|uniref:Heterokaryon incompatibility domain-containing protein n=1 Tax=Plenodomus tracheiphilus IPT5 TaxID=1408161 RepID=A0A6A7B2X1_9PLEO|nr:hypothetical protein T440DRAFT_533632 [Plenodomus tracheiphilus IPT5]
MFRWYQRAVKCYVHVTDILEPDEQAFQRSRWFTRDWTLEELLAPASVEFFSQNGKRLGSRISLA